MFLLSRPHEPLNNVVGWPVTPHLQRYLDSIGLGFLSRFQSGIRLDISMVSALVSKYDVDRCCFRLNNEDLYFGLVDVNIISGLRIDGKPVMGHLVDDYVGFINTTFNADAYLAAWVPILRGSPLRNQRKPKLS